MAGKTLLAHMQSQLETALRQVAEAAIDFRVPDDKLLELRSNAQRMREEVKALERKTKRGLLGLLGL